MPAVSGTNYSGRCNTARTPGPGSDLDIAAIYSKLGNKARALDLLKRAFTERNMWLMNLKVDPRFDDWRLDPRYESLLFRVGLT
jgi:hypothetical protein